MEDVRVNREKLFHNNRFTEEVRTQTGKYYKITSKSLQLFKTQVFSNCSNEQILEIGCSIGEFTCDLAAKNANVTGIDISEVAISTAVEDAAKLGLNADFMVMDASNLLFKDKSFDKVIGTGILHHLDYEPALNNIRRVIKSTGKAIFIEPLGHNPFINLYRFLTPKLRSEDEQPLRTKELKLLKKYFHNVELKFFYLTALLAVPFGNSIYFPKILSFFNWMDSIIFRIKFFQKFAWQVIIEVSEPK